MKTVHLSIIIVTTVTASAIIIALLASSFPQNQIPVYQYVIHEPYQGVDNDHGTVTIQNQTFHVQNLDKLFDNKSQPAWVQMYDVNFSFPNGIGPQNTSGGQIMESYIAFTDNPVPYRIAIGLGPSPNMPNYDYTTVLSTHKEPQAGFTIHDGTIQLLVNWSKIHSNLSVIDLNDTYRIGQPIDFQIKANGFDYFNAGGTPDINITKSDGTIIWQNPHYLVGCCPAELTDYDSTFNFAKLGGPIILNETGFYKVIAYYNHKTIEKDFTILDPLNGIKFDCKKPIGLQMDATYKYLNQTKAIEFAKTSPQFQSLSDKYDILNFNSIWNGFITGDPCNAYWQNVNVVFSGNRHDENYTWNVQVTEDPSLTRILNITEYQSGFAK